ncbi:uncharacterized protein LOC126252254 [Schistocerca nitens]|uniref:uncharacterized protein LOC126252254 n=1 Tax=Schistocerca nitens TaxID=7011 RepID=UPI0021183017|nr:uncharacterized protein LOC126252254 [Schistocerca nitens]
MNRIQKLLFSEYSELEELVLLESPFAETERNGNAIRQVQLGLTPRNLIIAGDMITPADEVEIGYCLGLDPEIETLELISIIPVECVNLSVFSRRKRRTLKAHFCNSVIKYYELGGSEHRKMFWNLWCEKVRFLSPSEDFSCLSETSAESSSSESSLYIKSKKHTVSESGKHRLWCQFGRGQAKDENVTAHEEQSIVSDNHVAELLPVNRSVLRGTSLTEIRVNFEEPFQKQCSNLFQKLYPENLSETAQKLDEDALQLWEIRKAAKKRHFRRYGFCAYPSFLNGFASTNLSNNDFYSVQVKRAVSALSLSVYSDEREFELPVSKCSLKLSVSLDGLSPGPRFLDTCHSRSRIFFWTPGFYYCPVTFHKMYQMLREHLQRMNSFLRKRAASVDILKEINSKVVHAVGSELAKGVEEPRENLERAEVNNVDGGSLCNEVRTYWYMKEECDFSVTDWHWKCLEFGFQNEKGQVKFKKLLTGENHIVHAIVTEGWSEEVNMHNRIKEVTDAVKGISEGEKKELCGLLYHYEDISRIDLFGTNYYVCDDSTLQYFKRKLKKNLKLTVWNFNSTTLAYQLTMIDRDLFCKIEEIEIEILLKQHSARNTPNIAAIIAFSHRISCLVATDILEQQNLKTRSLLIVRFISVAQRCDTLQNFQSCHSVLEGLQSPAIHRLHKTWERVRKEYPSKYCLFEKLCRKHRDPRLPAYQKAFYQASLKPPFLPFIGDILARALRRVPNFPLKLLSKSSQESFTNFNASGVQEVAAAGTRTVDTRDTAHSPSRKTRYIHCIRQFFSFFHIISVASVNSIMDNRNSEVSHNELPSPRKFEANSMQVPNIQTCCLLPNNGNGEVLFKNFNPGSIPSALHPNYSVLKVGGVIHLLDWYKRGAMVYDFTPDKLARDYLLKSHYQEETENYLLSTKLETTTNSDQQ